MSQRREGASCVALIVAAGRGERFGGLAPKQYARLGGQPLMRFSLRTFARHPDVTAVRAVIRPDDRELYDRAAAGLDLLPPVAGGATRAESVLRGLESLADLTPARVLIHDAARPLVGADLIARVVAALDEAPGAVPAVRVADTLKASSDGFVAATVSREGLFRAQTPQGFRFREILAANREAAGQAPTDDAAVAERAGLPVALVEGSERNIKVTTPEDLDLAGRLLGAASERCATGFGFDVHRFGPGDHVMLCGVRVPYPRGLVGHSDADVGLHALTDAILGAIGAGDIGTHFPPSDPRWKAAASHRFLRHARDLAAAAGGEVRHVDVTLVCEAPKIGPHRETMVARVAEILGLPPARVSVKATTTEGLGFTGRGEGIAAHAVATVALPGPDG